MATRSGGRYEIRHGKPVLIERTGYTPEAETPKKPIPDSKTPARQRASKEDE